MRFAAFGRTRMFLDAVDRCVRDGHDVVLLGTCAPAPEYGADEGDYQRLAGTLGCEFFSNARVDPELVRRSGAEVGISFNWLTLIPAAVRDAMPHGIVNAHPGDLPRYRGNACPNWAILNGEPAMALSFHRMSDTLDAGPILSKRRFELTERTYIGDVYDFLRSEMPAGFVSVLNGLSSRTILAEEQSPNPAESLRCYPRRPEDGLVDWSASAEAICRLVRASSEPFAGAFTFLSGRRVTIWRARPEPLPEPSAGIPGQVIERRADGAVAVLCGAGLVIVEDAEQSGKRGPPALLVRSLRQRFEGTRATLELDMLAERLGLRRTPDVSA